MSAEIEWSGDFDRFLDDKADAIETALRAQMGEATTNLLSYIKDQKLSGQVLNQRTGNLKNSGHATTSSHPQRSVARSRSEAGQPRKTMWFPMPRSRTMAAPFRPSRTS